MYLHIGGGRLVRDGEIIGVFDMDGRDDSPVNRAFLREAERKGRTSRAGNDLQRTFVLTDDGVVFTHISTAAVVGRAGNAGNAAFLERKAWQKNFDGGKA